MSPNEHGVAELSVHVERTVDPTVMRWVTHDPRLGASPDGLRCPSLGSAVGRMILGGTVTSVAIAGSDVLVTVEPATEWPRVIGDVHHAVLADLAAGGAWWDEPVGAAVMPTVAEVQQVIDGAAGEIMALHGGRIEVVAVVDGVVEVRMHGACHGCSASADTLQRVAWSAVSRAFPELRMIH